ncbi:Copper chaperone for superoxide dismutase [Fasciola hepatica]|uniref:Copper chaperone for superoxide dismutase n=1 Tax=Fasciola hepatica TaxID=6192 RepID=A0A4E0S003_FASHE|nr:Copper chaperone for superoxide dismutase [Fasciola hepatica]
MLIELAVKFDNAHTPAELENLLNLEEGVVVNEIDDSSEKVIVQSSIPVSRLLSTVNAAGFPVLFRGVSSQAKSMQGCDFGSGVAPLTSGEEVYGLCRLFQPTDEYLLVDVSLDKLNTSQIVSLAIHKCGDLSSSAYSCGDIYKTDSVIGEIGKTVANDQGQATLVVQIPGIQLRDLIGRSIVLHDASTKSRRVLCSLFPVICAYVDRVLFFVSSY